MKFKWPLLILLPFLLLPQTKQESSCLQTENDTVTAEDWEAGVCSDLNQFEYHIRYNETANTLTSPNRARNLRVNYSSSGFHMEPRELKAEKWTADFQIKGIYKGDEPVFIPNENPHRTLHQDLLTFTYEDPFTVEYLNNEKGMRQNFIVQERPEGKGDLKVFMEVETDLVPILQGEDDLVLTQPNLRTGAMEARAWYRDLKVWDATGEILDAHMELSETGDAALLALVVEDEGAAYPVTIDPLSTGMWDTQLESNQTGAQFGISVASAGDVNGDGYSDLIVGANAYDNGTADEGAAFIYYGTPSGVSTVAATQLESDQNGCNFGLTVSSAGDVNGDGFSDVIVGSPTWTDGELNEGAIWVYHGSPLGISTTPDLFEESNHVQGHLGFDVSGAGDINGDGFSDVVVGAPYWNGGLNDEGKFFVYFGSPSGLQVGSSQSIESNQLDAEFGTSVSAAGDVNGDGFSDVIIGSYLYDNGSVDEGAAFIYLGSGSGLQFPAVDTLENNQAGAWFGFDVANAGDVNGDGFADVGVSATLYSNGESQEGAIYVFEGTAAGVQPTASLQYESNLAGARLGNRVSTCGDFNGDGYADFMASSIRYTNPSPNEGAIMIFEGSPGGLSPVPTRIIESNQNSANMGSGIACAGDVNGDGISDITCGIFLFDSPDVNEGAVWVYHGGLDGLSSAPSLLESNQDGARMGQSVARAGDVNGDGFDDIIVGVDLYDNPTFNQGAAFVYYGSANGFSLTPDAILQGTVGNARFGASVDGAGDVNGDGYSDVIVGSPSFTGGQVGEGAVFIFHGSASGINTTPALTLQSNSNGTQMGNSVAGIGDVNGDGYADVAFGGWFHDSPEQDEGVVWVHHGGPLGIETVPSLTFESDQVQAFLGTAVAGAGDVNGDGYSDFLASAYRYDNGQNDEGVVFVFHGTPAGLVGPVQTLESNQADSRFGTSVASAGDVNGDGYSDVMVGAEFFDNGQSNEGVVQVYYGSSAGLPNSPSMQLEENQSSAYFGHSVASAGDVNGDGYNDVLVGAYFWDNGETNEGMIFVYHGSQSGLSTTASAQMENDQANSNLGTQVASAGDVNGDGYSDVVIGARGWDGGQTNEGGVFIYYGNENGNRSAPTRQYMVDLTSPLDGNGYLNGFNSFGIGQFAFSTTGRAKGKLVWEKVGEGQPFSGMPIQNGVGFTNESIAWTDMGTSGIEIKEPISLNNTTRTRWRVRVKYHPAQRIDGQVYSRWFYGTDLGAEDIGLLDQFVLPVELSNFTAVPEGKDQVQLNWTAASETGFSHYVIERSEDNNTFVPIGTEASIGTEGQAASYQTFDNDPIMGVSHYRLRMEMLDGEVEYSEIETVVMQDEIGIRMYPNPVSERLFVRVSNSEEPVKVNIIDMKGTQVHHSIGERGEKARVIEVSDLVTGIYIVEVESGRRKVAKKVVVR